jgi:hypothetical protein
MSMVTVSTYSAISKLNCICVGDVTDICLACVLEHSACHMCSLALLGSFVLVVQFTPSTLCNR